MLLNKFYWIQATTQKIVSPWILAWD